MSTKERKAWIKVCQRVPDYSVKPILDWHDTANKPLIAACDAALGCLEASDPPKGCRTAKVVKQLKRVLEL